MARVACLVLAFVPLKRTWCDVCSVLVALRPTCTALVTHIPTVYVVEQSSMGTTSNVVLSTYPLGFASFVSLLSFLLCAVSCARGS